MGKQRERGSMVRAGSALLLLLLLLSNYVFFHLSIQGLPGKFIGGEEGSAEFQVRSNSKAKNKLICFDLIFVITVPFSRQQCPLNCPAGPKGPQGIQGVKVGNLFFYVTLKNSLCEVFVQLYRLSLKVFFVRLDNSSSSSQGWLVHLSMSARKLQLTVLSRAHDGTSSCRHIVT